MTLGQAKTAIRNKQRALELARFDIGAASSGVEPAGSGGFVQKFARAHVFWHPNTGAHEVHGKILSRYLQLGGPGAHPDTGRREFGYPTADEARGLLGMEVSQFEFGAVYNVHGHRAVGVYGVFAKSGLDAIGPPVTEPTTVPGGQVLYCYEGCLFAPTALKGKILRATLVSPLMGNSALIAKDASRLPVSTSMKLSILDWSRLRASVQGDQDAALVKMFQGIWADRLQVTAVLGALTVPVTMTAKVRSVRPDGQPPVMQVDWTARIADRSAIPDRTLLNLRFSVPRSGVDIAPHAFYTAPAWDTFGFLHVTDLHVSRRVEGFRTTLRKAADAPGDSVRTIVNPNDSVRALFNYANQLYREKNIDFILATGDLVDYVFENGDDHNGGGNFRYLERLILGQAPSRDEEGVENQELMVPIYTVLGNHDYVVNPYRLLFDIDIPVLNDKSVDKWHGFNMVKKDAEILEGGGRPTVSQDAAKKMATSDRSAARYYHRRINRDPTYAVNLGDRHRIVIVDTGPNADGLDGNIDAIQQWLGSGANENERNFVRGLPSSTSPEFPRLARRLEGARPPGVVIVGMHNPPLNIDGNQFPHYFRESERPRLNADRLKALVLSFFSRVHGGGVFIGSHPDWSVTGTAYFKHGSIDDLLDFGVVKWTDRNEMEFFTLCEKAGVDAVFCGHVHERVEFRAEPDGNGGFRYFTDFYTENPTVYRESFDWGLGASDKRPIHITVDPAARVGERVRVQRDQRENGIIESRELRVPPYPNPLSGASNKVAWWKTHRPLILQTACVGPIDYSQRGARPTNGETKDKRRTSFQGVRWVRVRGDTIARISYVLMNDIRSGTSPNPPPRPERPPIFVDPPTKTKVVGS